MAFPNFEGKHAHEAMFSPKDYLDEFDTVVRGIRDDLREHEQNLSTMNLHDVLIHDQLPKRLPRMSSLQV